MEPIFTDTLPNTIVEYMKLAVIMPAYNEAGIIAKIIRDIPKRIPKIKKILVLVVDDGSGDGTAETALRNKAMVVRHVINLGCGAATVTGIKAALRWGADILVTIDADGQHDPREIPNLIKPIVSGRYDLVIGSRFKAKKRSYAPWHRVIGNKLMNIMIYCFYHIWVTDTQSGFKAMSRKAAGKMKLSFFGYEVCSEMIGEIHRRDLKYTEVPIRTIYSDYSMRKGQSVLNAINIFLRMVAKYIIGK